MKQYPHFLFIKKVSESVQDASGNWTNESESWSFHSICREQSNGKGATVNSQDAKTIVFSSLVHLPFKSPLINEGTEIFISGKNTTAGVSRIKGQVLKFDTGQLHNRLWL